MVAVSLSRMPRTVREQLGTLRACVQRGRPLGPPGWIWTTAARLGFEFTLRGPGRPRNNRQ